MPVCLWCVASQPNATCFRCLQAPAAALKLLVWTERGEDLGRGSGTTEDGGGGVGGGRVRRVQPQFRATRRQRAINCCKRQETRGRAPAPPPSPWPCPPPSCWCCTNNPCKGRWLFRYVCRVLWDSTSLSQKLIYTGNTVSWNRLPHKIYFKHCNLEKPYTILLVLFLLLSSWCLIISLTNRKMPGSRFTCVWDNNGTKI